MGQCCAAPVSRYTRLTACCVLLALAGCTATASSTGGGSSPAASPAGARGAARPVPPVHWHSCLVQGASMQCASLQVPLDYAHPGGRKITLALSRVAATAPASQQQGDLLVNPGGPGGPGRSLAAFVAQGLSPQVAADYNIIGFDPRGVGASVPALSCDPSFFTQLRPNYIPPNASAEQLLVSRARSYAADCQKRYGWLLPYLTTADSARDMNSIRAALGVPGDQLLRLLLRDLPGPGVRHPVPAPAAPDGAGLGGQPGRRLVRRQHRPGLRVPGPVRGVLRLGRRAQRHLPARRTRAQVQPAWYRARARLQAHPVDRVIGADDFDDTFLQGGYSNTLWPGLAAALATYLHSGSTAQIVSQYQAEGVQSENEFAVYNAVECS